jgi:asparagine synthase (glutamine-hydrolysing)
VDGICLAWCGEILNAGELCHRLKLTPGTPLHRALAAAWQEWASGFVAHLQGEFSLALLAGDELLLYRSHSGLSNLYWHTGHEGVVAFGTHLPSVLRATAGQARLASASLHEYLRFLDIAAPNTMFEGVHAVEAGQLVRWDAGGQVSRTWPASAAAGTTPADMPQALDRLDALLQRGVRVSLSGSSRPAAFLSGGIDSSLICAMAARQHKGIKALTVGFDAMPFDEAPIAQRIAAHLGMPHEVLRYSRAEYLSAFERLAAEMEQPMADPAAPATLLAFDHCHRHFDAVLDGTGADEAVGAMPPRHVRLAVGYASLLPRSIRRELARLLRAVPALCGYTPILDFEHPADTMIRWRGFTRTEIEELCGEPVSFEHTQFYRTFARFGRHAHFERYSALLDVMPSDRLSQAALITGLRVRYPFFDAETNRFIRQLRTDMRYLPGEPKRILRALLARYVPRDLWDVPKHGFDFPLHEFLSAENFQLVRRYLDPDRWRQTGLLSAERVQQYAQRFIAGEQRLAFRVWALVTLGAWLEKHELAF